MPDLVQITEEEKSKTLKIISQNYQKMFEILMNGGVITQYFNDSQVTLRRKVWTTKKIKPLEKHRYEIIIKDKSGKTEYFSRTKDFDEFYAKYLFMIPK